MSAVQIVEVERGSPHLDGVEARFREMYAYMSERGLILPLVEGGETVWRRSMEKTLGRVSVVYAAVQDGAVVGFARGVLRITPDYLGAQRVGSVDHVFVDPQLRQGGIGRRLVEALEDWFANRAVHSIELQVLVRNDASRAFFSRLGYVDELVQMRRVAGEAGARGSDGESA